MNNDMDDLFRKAADGYSLNTDSSDWQKVARGLAEDDGQHGIVVPFYKKYWYLLLIIPFGALLFFLNVGDDIATNVHVKPKASFTNGDSLSAQVQPQNSNQTLVGQETDLSSSREISGLAQPARSANKASSPQMGGLAQSARSANKANQPHNGSSFIEKTDGSSLVEQPGDLSAITQEGASLVVQPGSTSGHQTRSANDSSRFQQNNDRLPIQTTDQASNSAFPLSQNLISNTSSKEGKPSAGFKEGAQARTTEKVTARQTDKNPRVNEAVSPGLSEAATTEKELLPYLYEHKLLQLPQAVVSARTNILPKPITAGITRPSARFKRFYTGIVGGADLTSVQLQKLSNPGYHAGLILGYQLSEKLSVETGLLIEKKNYYTDPEYFEKGRIYTSPNARVLSVDGTCFMYEIPLSLKYDLHNTYRSNWFITGGVSSYIMRNEDYSMKYLYVSSGNIVDHEYYYKRTPARLFSHLRVTAGYSHNLPSGFSLRAEPYLAMPIGGVGYGKLNLFSAGFNVGVFRRLF